MATRAPLEALLEARLAALPVARRRQRRSSHVIDTRHPVRLEVDGIPCIAFCSNDYLGLSGHPDVIAALTETARRCGVGSGASHLVTGHGPEHEALEAELAAFTGRARALVFSTGYMANLGIASGLFDANDRVFEDRLNHASLLDAGLASNARFIRYRHADIAALEHQLSRSPSPDGGQDWILSDGVFSMDGDVAPLAGLAHLAREHGAHVVVDDAHGIGVLGADGRGSVVAAGLGPADIPVLMGTFGKALGTFGAFVAGSANLIDTLIQRSRTYIYTTALPPALAAATRTALQIATTETWRRERLQQHLVRFRAMAAERGWPVLPNASTPIQPLLLGSDEAAIAASEALLKEGILVTAIRPPTVPEGSARLRITFSAAHTDDDVSRLLEALGSLDFRAIA